MAADPVQQSIDDLEQHESAGAAKRAALLQLILAHYGDGVPVIRRKGDRALFMASGGELRYLAVHYLDDQAQIPVAS